MVMKREEAVVCVYEHVCVCAVAYLVFREVAWPGAQNADLACGGVGGFHQRCGLV